MSKPWPISEGAHLTIVVILSLLVVLMVTTVAVSYRRKERGLAYTSLHPEHLNVEEAVKPPAKPVSNRNISQYASFLSANSHS